MSCTSSSQPRYGLIEVQMNRRERQKDILLLATSTISSCLHSQKGIDRASKTPSLRLKPRLANYVKALKPSKPASINPYQNKKY